MKHFHGLVIVGGVWLLGGIAAAPALSAETQPTPEQIAFFEKSIRPVLVRECYSCHASTSKKIKGGLTLDTRDGMRKGGDNGPAVVPGDVKNSRLLQALRYEKEDL